MFVKRENICRSEISSLAREFLGTPWVHQGRLKGIGADCGGLIVGVLKEAGYADVDFTNYSRLADGKSLRAKCREYLAKKSVDDLDEGDVVLMRFDKMSNPHHLGFIAKKDGRLTLIHIIDPDRGCVEHTLSAHLRRMVVEAYSIPDIRKG